MVGDNYKQTLESLIVTTGCLTARLNDHLKQTLSTLNHLLSVMQYDRNEHALVAATTIQQLHETLEIQKSLEQQWEAIAAQSDQSKWLVRRKKQHVI